MLNSIIFALSLFASDPVVAAPRCEVVSSARLDGTKVEICDGSVTAWYDVDGSRRVNPYAAK